jgi:hypothetical protein
MKFTEYDRRHGEKGGAGIKFLLVLLGLAIAANAGLQYIPVAYQGASFKQEMDTAVVKGLAAPGGMKPSDVVKASIMKAARDSELPPEAVIEVKSAGNTVQAHVAYQKQVPLLPFGLYKYNYDFNYVATPTGYLLKEN